MEQLSIKAGYCTRMETTKEQPFPTGAGGCTQFRIPGLITLQNGALFATADARWTNADSDFGGIDTMYAISEDGGRTWRNGFAAYFPDSLGTPADPTKVTTCIDPTPMQTSDGVLHIFVNMNPSGITTGLKWPRPGSGYFTVNGKRYPAVTDCYENTDINPAADPEAYPYYLGDYENGFAPILPVKGGEAVCYADDYFNLYRKCKNAFEPMWQQQEESEAAIVQNLFYRRSAFHLFNTMYTLHLTSTDMALTWHAGLITAQIKGEDESGLIASPGNGLVLADGTALLPFYAMTPTPPDYGSVSRMILSRDNGKTWENTPPVPTTESVPWSGECKPVALPNGKIRLFLRNGTGCICYADYDMNTRQWDLPIKTDIRVTSACNFGAMTFEGQILIAYAAGENDDGKERVNGKLYRFRLDSECNMHLSEAVCITPDAFSYAVLTDMGNRTAGVLYDTCCDGFIILKSVSLS